MMTDPLNTIDTLDDAPLIPHEDLPPAREPRPSFGIGTLIAVIPVIVAMLLILTQGNQYRALLSAGGNTVPDFVWDDVTLVEEPGSADPVFLTFTIHNFSLDTKVLGSAFGVFVMGDTEPSAMLPFESYTIEGSASQTITLRGEIDLPPGEYQVVAWFREVVNGEQVYINNVTYSDPILITGTL